MEACGTASLTRPKSKPMKLDTTLAVSLGGDEYSGCSADRSDGT
jgi:hypothetical protein